MPNKPAQSHWNGLSMTLHWLTVVLLVVMAWLGLTMGDLPNGPDKIATFALHKSIGLSILALVIVRLGWRLYAGAPAALPSISRAQQTLASAMHIALYLLLLAMPMSGWVMNSATGFPLQWFGLFNLPALTSRNHDLHELTETIHEWLFWAMVALVVLHAAAAIYHHLFQRDATLARMLPRGWLRMDD